MAAVFFAASVLAFILWGTVDKQLITNWLVCIYIYVLLLAIRLWLFKHKNHIMSSKGWAINNIVGTVISACLWGAVPFLFMDFSSPAYTSIIIVVVVGTTVGTLASASVYPPSYVSYTVPCLLLTVTALFINPEEKSNYLAVLCLGFLIVNLAYCRNIYHTIKDAIRLRIEHVELLRQLEIKSDIAERANISKSKFLAAASHDLRQPVHALSIFTDALKNIQTAPEDVKALTDKISRSVNGLESLFNSLLDISQLDAGTVDVNNEHYNLKIQCEELLAELKPQLDIKNLIARVETASDLADLTVHSDKLLVRRILSNLLTNAINYTQSGSIVIQLSNSACENDQQGIKISIIDTGKGIPASDLTKIFDEYHQLHNPERDRNKGLGLGLSISKRLADLLDTKIEVTSTLDKGSTFSFTLQKGSSDKINTIKVTNTLNAEMFLAGKCLMVIDDEQDIRDAMTALLVQWGGANIICTADQFEACEAIDNGDIPDIIISDYRLRDNRNGIDAIEAVREKAGLQIPALIISGDTGQQAMTIIKESGFMLLHKPVAPAKLKIAINTLFNP